jgi:hypothetical protein
MIFKPIVNNNPMYQQRSRITYSLLIIMVILLGLGSRHFARELPHWMALYLGDALWALMIFLMVGFLFPKASCLRIASLALAFSFSIECSQLYHATWIDAIRANKLGGLILGYGFLWSDLVCYLVGIAFGVVIEKLFFVRR